MTIKINHNDDDSAHTGCCSSPDANQLVKPPSTGLPSTHFTVVSWSSSSSKLPLKLQLRFDELLQLMENFQLIVFAHIDILCDADPDVNVIVSGKVIKVPADEQIVYFALV